MRSACSAYRRRPSDELADRVQPPVLQVSVYAPRMPASRTLDYEPLDAPPISASVKIAGHLTVIVIIHLSMLPMLAVRLTGKADSMTFQVVTATLAVCGVIMLLLSSTKGPFNARHLYALATYPPSLPFCVLALAEGGLTTLSALVVVTGLFQIIIGTRLSRLRKFIAPTINSTMLALVCISLIPVLYRSLISSHQKSVVLAIPMCISITAITILLVQKRGPKSCRIHAGTIGIAVGIITSMIYGIYNYETVSNAAWISLPNVRGWKSDPDFYKTFFTLLPSFLILSFMNLSRTNNMSILTQFTSWRQLHSVDFKDVQRTNTSIGLGSMLCGLAGSMPITISPLGPALIKESKCASKRIGLIHGAMLLIIACFPKMWSIVIASTSCSAHSVLYLSPSTVGNTRSTDIYANR